jgi:multicomponent Na+:H+ antiporter subunit D
MTGSMLITACVLLPLLAAVPAFVWPRSANGLGLLAALGTVLAVAALCTLVWSAPQAMALGGWLPPLGIRLSADGLSALMLAMTAIVALAVSVYAPGYFAPATRARFWPLWLVLWSAMNALYLSGDLFNLYVTLELLGLSAVALVTLAGGRDALKAAMRYLLVSLTGSLAYLMGVALLYTGYGVLDLSQLGARVQPGVPEGAALALMSTGLMMKSALFPLHFWLPPAHGSAPAPVSALLSALVVKASFYLLLRLWLDVFGDAVTPALADGFGALGALAIVWGSLAALRADRLKLMVAYSTVAQLGYLFLVFPLAARAGAAVAVPAVALFALSHALAKAAMFMAVGNVQHAVGHDRIRELDGVGSVLPVAVLSFSAAGVSLIGLPPSGGFAAKWLLLQAAFDAPGGAVWIVVVLTGGLLAAAYVFRVLYYVFAAREAVCVLTPLPAAMRWPPLVLALAALLLSLVARWPVELVTRGLAP